MPLILKVGHFNALAFTSCAIVIRTKSNIKLLVTGTIAHGSYVVQVRRQRPTSYFPRSRSLERAGPKMGTTTVRREVVRITGQSVH
jgi:hypothetical protein